MSCYNICCDLDNIYDTASTDDDAEPFQSEFLLVNVDAGSDSPAQRRRRRLQARNYDEETYLSSCSPIILTFNTTNASYWDANFPRCAFFNESTQEYDDDGCYVVASDSNGQTICACVHLTYFGVQGT